MRGTDPPRTWARVAMVRVLASPGTPSNNRCPPDSNATSTRSSTPSSPTINHLLPHNPPLGPKQRRLEGRRRVGGIGDAEAARVVLGHLVSLRQSSVLSIREA